jgi:amidohydrolase
MDISGLKTSMTKEIDKHQRQLAELSRKIHSCPEVAFQETQASAWLTEFLEDNGFTMERGICDLPTAFRGTYGTGKPVMAFLAEYDALPKVGHACGHNLIATSSVAAATAARLAVDKLGGRIVVMGTPAEESHGGKVIMVEKGAFDGVDMAMMVHPAVADVATIRTLACQSLEVEFFGKAAHAAARPEAGINALEAMIQSYNAINSLRQHVKDKARIHGIITDGGEAANIVPAHTAARFIVRADDDAYLDELKEKVIGCFAGAALATGARLEYRWEEGRYATMLNNMAMARLFESNMKSLGHNVYPGIDVTMSFSTDVGNVSQILPTIQPLVAVAPPDVLLHSPEFATEAASTTALSNILDAAKAMAMIVADVLADPALFAEIQNEFKNRK